MKPSPPAIFDRALYRRRRGRSALDTPLFLTESVAAQMADRVAAINRKFKNGLDLGTPPSVFPLLRGLAASFVRSAAGPGADVMADEEALPFAPTSFDLVTSTLALHAANDLPGALLQIRQSLRPDGLFLAALFGGETLRELRHAFAAGEAETLGGASPRVAPFAENREFGALLQRAGFALPVVDVERTTVRYRDPMRLFADLRAMGETNALRGRRRTFLSRRTLEAVLREYASRFVDAEGRFLATFDVVFLTGWAPHESQQKPLKPGSAKARLADALRAQHPSAAGKPEP